MDMDRPGDPRSASDASGRSDTCSLSGSSKFRGGGGHKWLDLRRLPFVWVRVVRLCPGPVALRPAAFLKMAARFQTASYSPRVVADCLLLAAAEDHYVPMTQFLSSSPP